MRREKETQKSPNGCTLVQVRQHPFNPQAVILQGRLGFMAERGKKDLSWLFMAERFF